MNNLLKRLEAKRPGLDPLIRRTKYVGLDDDNWVKTEIEFFSFSIDELDFDVVYEDDLYHLFIREETTFPVDGLLGLQQETFKTEDEVFERLVRFL